MKQINMDERENIDYKKAYEDSVAELQFFKDRIKYEREQNKKDLSNLEDKVIFFIILALAVVACLSVGMEYPVDDMNYLSVLWNIVVNGFGLCIVSTLLWVVGSGIYELLKSKIAKGIAIVFIGFIALAIGSYLNKGQQDLYEDGYKEGERAGYSSGYDEGTDEGYEYGFDEGYSVGYSDGYDDAS